jgi:putative flippase GtrA
VIKLRFGKKQFIVQFVKFSIIGVFNTIISYVIYSIFIYLNSHYLAASICAFVVGVLNAFYWNSKYVFKKISRFNHIKSLSKIFIAYGITGLLLQNLLLYFYIEIFQFSAYLAPVFCLFITVPSNFLLNKFWVFKQAHAENT